MDRMKALVAPRYGSPEVLRFETLPIPEPSDHELLIRVAATTVNRTDTGILSGTPAFARVVFGLLRPKRRIVGTEFSGVVEAVGSERTDFKVGDRVFGFHDEGTSAHAEFLTVSQRDAIALIPDGISFENATAASEGPFYALNLLRNISLKPGARVLINGISGSIGSAMLQLLKLKDAYVEGVCSATAAPLLAELGADKLHDYQRTDFREVKTHPYDFILDTVGNRSFLDCRPHLTESGTYASTELGPWGQNVVHAMTTRFTGSRRAIFPIPYDVQGCQRTTLPLLAQKKYRPLIDRTFLFEQIIDAYRFVCTGKKTGNVVVTFNS